MQASHVSCFKNVAFGTTATSFFFSLDGKETKDQADSMVTISHD
jgi:hypothetical protein